MNFWLFSCLWQIDFRKKKSSIIFVEHLPRMFQLSLLNPGNLVVLHKLPFSEPLNTKDLRQHLRASHWYEASSGPEPALLGRAFVDPPNHSPNINTALQQVFFFAKQHELRSRVSASILANSADMSFMRSFSCLGHRSLQVHAQPKRKEGSVTRLQLRCLICWSLFSISASCRGMATRWSNKPQACSREIWANCARTKLQLLCS